MSSRTRRSRWSFARNLVAGDYGPLERLRLVVANVGKRSPTQHCCGNYGDPGC